MGTVAWRRRRPTDQLDAAPLAAVQLHKVAPNFSTLFDISTCYASLGGCLVIDDRAMALSLKALLVALALGESIQP